MINTQHPSLLQAGAEWQRQTIRCVRLGFPKHTAVMRYFLPHTWLYTCISLLFSTIPSTVCVHVCVCMRMLRTISAINTDLVRTIGPYGDHKSPPHSVKLDCLLVWPWNSDLNLAQVRAEAV